MLNLKLSPSEFWRLTPSELDLLTGEFLDQAEKRGHVPALKLEEAEEMVRKFEERQAAKAAARKSTTTG